MMVLEVSMKLMSIHAVLLGPDSAEASAHRVSFWPQSLSKSSRDCRDFNHASCQFVHAHSLVSPPEPLERSTCFPPEQTPR